MQVKDHVAGNVTNGGSGVGCSVVEEPDGCIVGTFSGMSLVSGDGAECDEHGGINGDGIV